MQVLFCKKSGNIHQLAKQQAGQINRRFLLSALTLVSIWVICTIKRKFQINYWIVKIPVLVVVVYANSNVYYYYFTIKIRLLIILELVTLVFGVGLI